MTERLPKVSLSWIGGVQNVLFCVSIDVAISHAILLG